MQARAQLCPRGSLRAGSNKVKHRYQGLKREANGASARAAAATEKISNMMWKRLTSSGWKLRRDGVVEERCQSSEAALDLH